MSGAKIDAGKGIVRAFARFFVEWSRNSALHAMLADGITKLYYTIGEVSALVGEEAHVLRYWETEFSQLRPKKNRSGKRVYTNEDIDLVFRIRRLLRDNKFTIDGARKALREVDDLPIQLTEERDLRELREFLVHLRDRIREAGG